MRKFIEITSDVDDHRVTILTRDKFIREIRSYGWGSVMIKQIKEGTSQRPRG